MFWMQDILQLTEEDRILQKTAIGFDGAVWEWILPLTCGFRLFIAAPGGHRDPVYLSDNIIQEQSISSLDFVPSMLSVFVDHLKNILFFPPSDCYCGEALMAPFNNRHLMFYRIQHSGTCMVQVKLP